MFEFIIAFCFGIFAGCVTGLFPGIHINLVAAGLLASVGFFSGIEPIVLVVFIVAMAVTHSFIDFIPSVYLGAPDEDSFLSVLPGHQLLKEGFGHEAVVLTLYGSLTALGIVLIFSFIFVWVLPFLDNFVRVFLPFVLIFVSLFLIFKEDDFVLAFVVFLMSGFLGLLVFNLPVREPMLPLLSGLFGISGLIVSLKNRTQIPKQEIKKLREISLGKKNFLRASFAAIVAAPFCSFLPGIGSGHAAVLGSEISGDDKRGFLFLVGAINTIVLALSFVTIYSIGRTRSGAAVAALELLGEIVFENLVLIIFVIILSGMIAFILGVYLSKFFALRINKIEYSKISFVIIGTLFVVNFVLSNWIGILVLVVSSALGVFCILSKVRRIQLMGVLLIPTIVFYLTI